MIIQFTNAKDQSQVIGHAVTDLEAGTVLVDSPSLHSVVEGMTAAEVEEKYGTWSNGYVRSKPVDSVAA
jgi:hypothetical protein